MNNKKDNNNEFKKLLKNIYIKNHILPIKKNLRNEKILNLEFIKNNPFIINIIEDTIKTDYKDSNIQKYYEIILEIVIEYLEEKKTVGGKILNNYINNHKKEMIEI